ncbi:MAG TPA: NAD(P)H-dependent oxidoreductase [Phormidium sp.]
MISAVVAPEQVLQQLNWRYATKKFDPSKKIPTEVWKTLEQSLILAPSSYGLQPWKFFVVNNPEIRQQLVEHSWGQTQVVDASHLVVLAIKKDLNAADVDRYVQRMSEVREVPVDTLQGLSNLIKNFLNNPPINVDEWSARQVYIALGQLMTCAAMLEIDTCPMEGFNSAKYNELLGLTEQGYSAVVVCPLGYRAADDKYAVMPKVRFPTEELVQYI